MTRETIEQKSEAQPMKSEDGPTMMKKVIQRRYGSPEVLEIIDTPLPEVGHGQLLVRVGSTSVTATESVFRQGKPYFSRLFTGFRKPKNETLGEEVAGEVIEIGEGVTRYRTGDMIFGSAGPKFGAAAEYLLISEDEAITRMPMGLSPAEAAGSVDGFLTAMPFLRDVGGLKKGQRILINGASGSVGSAAVQIARHFGAEVTAVCSARNLDFVRSLGADEAVDYTAADFPESLGTYDVIFDAVGKISFRRFRKFLVHEGRFLEAGMNLGILWSVLVSAVFGGKRAKIAATGLRPAVEKKKDLELLRELMEAGTFRPTIDRIYPLDEIREAHRYVDRGRKRGNVVISVVNSGAPQ
jgi:NADPH:quinone reductase-like Zn-dependent oxidoreductase